MVQQRKGKGPGGGRKKVPWWTPVKKPHPLRDFSPGALDRQRIALMDTAVNELVARRLKNHKIKDMGAAELLAAEAGFFFGIEQALNALNVMGPNRERIERDLMVALDNVFVEAQIFDAKLSKSRAYREKNQSLRKDLLEACNGNEALLERILEQTETHLASIPKIAPNSTIGLAIKNHMARIKKLWALLSP